MLGRQKDRQVGRWTYGLTDGRTDRQTKGKQTDRQVGGRVDGWTDGQIDRGNADRQRGKQGRIKSIYQIT